MYLHYSYVMSSKDHPRVNESGIHPEVLHMIFPTGSNGLSSRHLFLIKTPEVSVQHRSAFQKPCGRIDMNRLTRQTGDDAQKRMLKIAAVALVWPLNLANNGMSRLGILGPRPFLWGFPPKNDQFGVWNGGKTHHVRKHPNMGRTSNLLKWNFSVALPCYFGHTFLFKISLGLPFATKKKHPKHQAPLNFGKKHMRERTTL